MNIGLKQLAATSLVALMLGTGLAGCSLPSIGPSDKESSVTTVDPAAKDLQQMVDEFYRQVKADTMSRDAITRGTGTTAQEDFYEDFKGSLAYVKSGAMTKIESRKMLATFARLYAVDHEATVVTAAEDFVVSGDTAYIKSGRLKVTTKGKLQSSYKDSESATLYFERIDGKWMISKFNATG